MTNKFFDSLKTYPGRWIGTALFAIGSVVISVSPNMGLVSFPFFLFLVGHILWFKAGFDAQDKTLIALNGMYIPFDLYAIVLRPDFL